VLNSTEAISMTKSLANLEKQAAELSSYISKGKKVTNELIFKKLTAIHNTFHEIAGLCKE
jgi:DNA gyrase/topoisomerase IV subunit A